jgi:hypothetical protein
MKPNRAAFAALILSTHAGFAGSLPNTYQVWPSASVTTELGTLVSGPSLIFDKSFNSPTGFATITANTITQSEPLKGAAYSGIVPGSLCYNPNGALCPNTHGNLAFTLQATNGYVLSASANPGDLATVQSGRTIPWLSMVEMAPGGAIRVLHGGFKAP